MKLVFIHGWGLNAHLWDGIRVLLPNFDTEFIERGFFGATETAPDLTQPAILIGHSLGLIHGFNLRQDWSGWIAINSFPRFVAKDNLPGCVPASVLREMRQRLQRDTAQTLAGFYRLIGTTPPEGKPDGDKLRAGLDELQSGDIAAIAAMKTGMVLASRSDPLVPAATSGVLAQGNRQWVSWRESASHVLPQTDAAWCAGQIDFFMSEYEKRSA